MAVLRNTYETLSKLEAYCKAEWEEARYRGDMRRADEIHNFFETRKREIEMGEYDGYMNAAQNTSLGQIMGTGTIGTASQYPNTQQLQAMTQLAQSKTDFKPELGVLYLHHNELPADWSGARITDYKRAVDAHRTYWLVVFSSKWDKALEIRLYLDMEDINGKEAIAMAETFKEALNQRRSG